MSEPTGDGTNKPDPDAQPGPGPQDESQEESSGSLFSDPTAPVWADPTAPIPASPAPPGAAYPPYGQQPPAGAEAPPPPPPPMSNPYAQQPPTDPYAQPAGQSGQPSWTPTPPDPYGQPTGQGQYGQPQYGGQYPAYGQSPYATGAPSNTSAIILTIVSGVSMLSTAFLVGIPSLVFGILALTSNSTDPVGSRKKSRIGWIIYAINAALVIIFAVGIAALVLITGSTSDTNSGF